MFETTEVILGMLQIYLIAGFALGILYNIFRFVRLTFPKMIVVSAVLDFVFAIISGLVLFILSAAYGMGYFRLYYIFAAAVGFAANMLTLGFVVPPVSKLLRRVIKTIYRWIAYYTVKWFGFIHQKLTSIFIKIGENITKINEKCKIHLKKHSNLVYNNIDHKIGELYGKGGETRNAIKAKVKKIG